MYELKLVPFNQTEYLDRFLERIEAKRLGHRARLSLLALS
jgi:hypothetical protein